MTKLSFFRKIKIIDIFDGFKNLMFLANYKTHVFGKLSNFLKKVDYYRNPKFKNKNEIFIR